MMKKFPIMFLAGMLAVLMFPAMSSATAVHWTCNDDGFEWIHILWNDGTTWSAQTDRTCGPGQLSTDLDEVRIVIGEVTQGPPDGLAVLYALERDARALNFNAATVTTEMVDSLADRSMIVSVSPGDMGEHLTAFLNAADPAWRESAPEGDPRPSQAPAQCIAKPQDIAFWARFEGSLGPDSVRDQTARGALSPARQLVNTDIPGHQGQFLRRGGADSQVWFDSPAGTDPATPFLGLSDFSLEFWIRIDPAAMATASNGTIGILDTITTRQSVVRGINVFAGNSIQSGDGFLRFMMRDGAAADQYRTWSSETGIADGRWHHVAISIDRGSETGGRMFIEGSIVNIVAEFFGRPDILGLTGYRLFQPQPYFDPTVIAGRLGQAHNVAFGLERARMLTEPGFDIDEVAFYNRALSAAEMAALARSPKCFP